MKNDDADDLDTGYLAGFKLGKAKSKGSWQFQYQYEDLEADATLGAITDSDFMGGGTDGEGHKFWVPSTRSTRSGTLEQLTLTAAGESIWAMTQITRA